MKKNSLWKQLHPAIRRMALSGCLAMGLLLSACGQSFSSKSFSMEAGIDNASAKADQGIATYATEAAGAVEESMDTNEEVPGGYYSDGEVETMNTAEAEYAMAAEGASPEDLSTDSAGSSSVSRTDRKLIRNMSLSLETTTFDDFIANVETQVDAMGGYVEESSVSGGSGYQTLRYGYMTVRIPADRLDTFADAITGSATVLNRRTSVSDVTLQYSDLETHMEALKIEQKTLMDMLAKAEEIETVLAIQNQLTDVRYELESYGSRLKVMENQVSYSTVSIDISEVEIPTPVESDTFGSKVSRTFRNSMTGFARGLEDFLVWFLGNIVFIAAFIVIVILIFLGLRKTVRRWKEKRNKAALSKETENTNEEDNK